MAKSHPSELRDCDRCGFTYRKDNLKNQQGMHLSDDCFDDIRRIARIKTRFSSPRSNSTTVDAVTSPTTFSITAGSGVNVLSNSTTFTREGTRTTYFMLVVGSGGPVNITADPQIIAGTNGAVLTLKGTSDTNTVQLDDGTGLLLFSGLSMILKNTDVITLVYTSADALWREVSRIKGGF